MPRKIQRYGWLPQDDDPRDLVREHDEAAQLPTHVDLTTTKNFSPVYDQGQLGSCTANALAAAFDFIRHHILHSWVHPSRLWIYWQERNLEGTVDQDSGAQIRDGIKVVHKLGVPPERDWPYDVTKFAEHPPTKAGKDAALDVAIEYRAPVQSLQGLRSALAAGLPIVFGFTVYEEFESDEVAQTGIVPMPGPASQPVGGHATVICGYDDATKRFKIRNSWGPDWGIGGYFWLPYAYVLSKQLSSDFWCIEAVSA